MKRFTGGIILVLFLSQFKDPFSFCGSARQLPVEIPGSTSKVCHEGLRSSSPLVYLRAEGENSYSRDADSLNITQKEHPWSGCACSVSRPAAPRLLLQSESMAGGLDLGAPATADTDWPLALIVVVILF